MSGHDAIDKSRDILNQRFDLPPMGDDPVSNYRLRYTRVTQFC